MNGIEPNTADQIDPDAPATFKAAAERALARASAQRLRENSRAASKKPAQSSPERRSVESEATQLYCPLVAVGRKSRHQAASESTMHSSGQFASNTTLPGSAAFLRLRRSSLTGPPLNLASGRPAGSAGCRAG